ncbi:MAG: hypothetical protein ACUVTM_03490 [Candidatus Bathyarchaeia archaeon]
MRKVLEPLIERLTAHISYAEKEKMQRLSWLMPVYNPWLVEDTRHDGWARANQDNTPPPYMEIQNEGIF